tara:strand:- start:761 stop:2206 length:1446 start_codon:yes stop_codon:yes gene_type:complete
MAIQIYDMGLDFTKGEGDKPESISDFRKKQAETNQANAQADKYRADKIETERKNAAAEKQAADFKQIIKDNTDPKSGDFNQEGAENAIYNYQLATDPENAAKFKKDITAERKNKVEIKEKRDKKTGEDATHLARNANPATLKYIANRMVTEGDPNGQLMLDWYAANPNAGEKEIRARVMEYVPDSAKQPKYEDIGGKLVNTNVLYLGASSLDKTKSQDILSREANNKLVAQAKVDAAVTKQAWQVENARMGKVPDGYQRVPQPDGTLKDVMIAGGEVARKEANAAIKESFQRLKESEKGIKDMDIFIGQIKKLRVANEDWWSWGMTGYIGSFWKGSDAHTKELLVESIKANTGFNKLAEMRAASGDGSSGLGQIAVKELQLLQSTIAALDPNMSDTAMKTALKDIEKAYNAARKEYDKVANAQGIPPWAVTIEGNNKAARTGLNLNNKSSGLPRTEKEGSLPPPVTHKSGAAAERARRAGK